MVTIFVMELEKEVLKFLIYYSMDIKLEKLNLIKLIEDTNDLTVIQSVKNFFKTEKKDWWDELSDEQKVELKFSLDEFDNGKYSSFEEFITPYL
jgi:hypothetical protein